MRDATAVAAAIDTGVAKLGRLDIVVANAGIAMYDAADTMSAQSWRDMIDANLTGVWTVCRGAMPHMIEEGRGGAMSSSARSQPMSGCCTSATTPPQKQASSG